jgi:hypothetical protein
MDTMALNSEYVGTMQTAIETYISDVETAINEHVANTVNPHGVTKELLGIEKPVEMSGKSMIKNYK